MIFWFRPKDAIAGKELEGNECPFRSKRFFYVAIGVSYVPLHGMLARSISQPEIDMGAGVIE